MSRSRRNKNKNKNKNKNSRGFNPYNNARTSNNTNPNAFNHHHKNKKVKKINHYNPDFMEIDYTLDSSVKQLFLNLTLMQIIFDKEHTLEPLLPKNIEKDEFGNYFMKIGETDTMFCSHLDTYTHVFQRVYHVIENNLIKTDGTSTLGADDKAGVTIMIKMIENKIPGLYYFFRGEEGVTSPSGTWGSKQVSKNYKELFSNYKRCIAFDRRGKTSIITSQSHKNCCSDDFSEALIKEFADNGMDYKKDTGGYWCDSGSFMEIIPECTNISVGYLNEHTKIEEQDIEFLEKLVNTCIKIDWNNLPVKRDPKDIIKYTYSNNQHSRRNYNWSLPDIPRTRPFIKRDYVTMEDMFFHVNEILGKYDFRLTSKDEVFCECVDMYYLNSSDNDFFMLKIIDFEIFITDNEECTHFISYGKNLEYFERMLSLQYELNDEDDEEEELYDDSEYYANLWDRLPHADLQDFISFHDEFKDVDPHVFLQSFAYLPSYIRGLFIEYAAMFLKNRGSHSTFSGDRDLTPVPDGKITPLEAFTTLQLDMFAKIVEKYCGLVTELIKKYFIDGELRMTEQLYKKLENCFESLNIDISGDITPEDFIAWVKYNADIKEPEIDVTPVKNNNSFLATISQNETYYTKKQYLMFSNIIIHNENIVSKIIIEMKKNESPKINLNLEAELDLAIDHLNMSNEIREGRRKFNAKEFLLFIYDYMDDIITYYEELIIN